MEAVYKTVNVNVGFRNCWKVLRTISQNPQLGAMIQSISIDVDNTAVWKKRGWHHLSWNNLDIIKERIMELEHPTLSLNEKYEIRHV